MLVSLAGSLSWAKPVTAVLRLQARTTMEELARQVTDPNSPRYQKFFTPEEIREISAPSDIEYENQIQQLQSEGFRIVGESKTHLWVSVTADSSKFENIFLTRVRTLNNGRHQLISDIHIPSHWNLVEGITGIDSSTARHPHYRINSGVQPTNANSPQQGVLPEQIKKIYDFNSLYAAGLTGAGQHIAIMTYNDVNLSDIKGYYANINLNPVPAVDRVLFNGNPPQDENSSMETSLDAEFSGMIAPGASIHVFTSAENSDAGETQMFTAVLDDNRAKVVNYSWGDCEKDISAAHVQEMTPILQRAVAQGVNMMVASGDTGSASCQNDNSVQADWPAANPNVVAVGGTALHISGSTTNETAWGPCFAGWTGCSGGGISELWDLPSYQQGFAAPYTKRSYPDISFNADNMTSGEPVWVTSNGKQTWIVIGGTSMAAPQWSGLMALVGEGRAKQGKETLGFLNPIIYGMSSTQKAQLLTDVTSGSNGAYKAAAGWDAVTGWGSPKAGALVNYLISQ
jgi:kumamolisin